MEPFISGDGQYLFFNSLTWVNRRRPLIFNHIARHQMATIGRCIKKNVIWSAFDPTF